MQRSVFLTGVGRGLGREIAQGFVDQGWRVFGSTNASPCDLDLAGLVTLDQADPESIAAAMAQLAETTDHLDLLINCAGVDARTFGGDPDHRGVFDFDADLLNAVLNVNVTGPMLITKATRPLLQAGTDAMIVNVSSQLGSMQVAATKGRDAGYCVSKAALNMLSVKTAAALVDDRIGVVMLHPGWVQTDMGGPSAPLTIDESAEAIVATTAALTFADSGRFIRWDGSDHPW